MMSLKLYGDVKFIKLRIGEEDAKAPMVMCGYFNLNHAASTAKTNKLVTLFSPYMSITHSLHLQKRLPEPAIQLIETIRQKFYYWKKRTKKQKQKD
jgi:hypothetical protein